jgi:hypothetical protein
MIMTKFIPKPEEPQDSYNLRVSKQMKDYLVGETISLQLSRKTFSHILACLDKLRTHVQDEQVAKAIGILMTDLVHELTPNQQSEMLAYYLKVSPDQADQFIAMQKQTTEEN